MSKHHLGGGASVEVLGIDRVFQRAPTSITSDGKYLTFGNRDATSPSARIGFRFKATGTSDAHRFGIKQLCLHESHAALYEGIKVLDGGIWAGTTSLDGKLLLDLSASSLTVLFEADTDVSTGARAVAAHAPFFSALPMRARPGVPMELGIIDSPGGTFPLERRNVATDRLNYLMGAGASSRFLTVLVVVMPDGQHSPLVGLRWRWEAVATIAHNDLGKARLDAANHQSVPIQETLDFTDAEVTLLTDASLTAANCISQKFNDAMYRTVGLHQRQDFNKPTKAQTVVSAGGYAIEQYPGRVAHTQVRGMTIGP